MGVLWHSLSRLWCLFYKSPYNFTSSWILCHSTLPILIILTTVSHISYINMLLFLWQLLHCSYYLCKLFIVHLLSHCLLWRMLENSLWGNIIEITWRCHLVHYFSNLQVPFNMNETHHKDLQNYLKLRITMSRVTNSSR